MIGPIITLAPVLLVIAVGDDAPEQAEELRRHQGTWAVERSIRNGQQGPEDAVKEIVRVVDGNRIVWKRDGKSFAATKFELDSEADPKTIDLIPEGGRNRGERVLGIYTFEDDRLVICSADAGQPRPTAFSAGPGERTTLMTFRRVDRAEPAPIDAP